MTVTSASSNLGWVSSVEVVSGSDSTAMAVSGSDSTAVAGSDSGFSLGKRIMVLGTDPGK